MLIIELAKKGQIHIDKKTREIGLQRNYDNEEFIARELYRIANAPIKPISNIDSVIEACEREVGITYSDEQRQAIHACLTQNVSILTALGGSGKTSSMMTVARAIRENGQYAAACDQLEKKSGLHRDLSISRHGGIRLLHAVHSAAAPGKPPYRR